MLENINFYCIMPAKLIKIAIDAMGGDDAPDVPVNGIKVFLSTFPSENVIFKVYGDEQILRRKMLGIDRARYEIIHCENKIESDEKPSLAVRQSKGTSMRAAIEAVSSKECDASISGGNTGALMALSKIILKTAKDIDRPAICAMMPTKSGKCVLLDMGANIDVTAQNLLEFAFMGEAFAQVVLKKRKPTVGLLNIGSEEMKGHAYIHEAAEKIRASHLKDQFIGYIEPDKIYTGEVDVIVTDGFTGNIVIKSAEGLGKMIKILLKRAFSSSIFAVVGAILCGMSVKRTMKKMDPNNYNGGMFIGLNGVSIKSHGGADKYGFANAIMTAVSIVKEEMHRKIVEKINLS
ncbi:phosphate acyltransferase PlsX [Candidatus Deianiraea vastatrix]|uniref:Phosphate acyltransferase n=1 Tax=Candidatus Deianiraea vastatrix TaxID=2163644 RepID=A0A5B8XF93_9RICK|nr:phosphate acyltransferase PlsX [Candidatus Deianiraea vastatrix]QED23940.1 Phosphate acyltransferase [Candidatus Deianiraea vastatrix]